MSTPSTPQRPCTSVSLSPSLENLLPRLPPHPTITTKSPHSQIRLLRPYFPSTGTPNTPSEEMALACCLGVLRAPGAHLWGASAASTCDEAGQASALLTGQLGPLGGLRSACPAPT